MKRLVALLLLHLYLFFSGSRVLAYHYCGDVLAETEINAKAHCCCESMEEASAAAYNNDNCCLDIIKPIKQPDTNLQSVQTLFNTPCYIDYPASFVSFNPFVIVSASRSTTTIIYPPPKYVKSIPAYLQFHALLLYA